MEYLQISNGKCTASVWLKGAQLASFKAADGREVMWQADPAVWPNHAPVLFPVCGSTRDNKISIDGVDYPLPKHGFTRSPIFEVAAQSEGQVDVVLKANEETKKMYPFDFEFHVIYTLNDAGYTTTFRVVNCSDKVMPFCVGGHPGFIVPMHEGESFTDYQLVFPQVEDGRNSLAPNGYLIDGSEYLDCFHDTDTLPLDHALFDARDALLFTELKSRSVKLVNKKTGKGLRFDYPDMEVLAVWTKPGANADYLCLEPWHGMPSEVGDSGRFEDKPFVTMLQPGCAWTGSFTMTLI